MNTITQATDDALPAFRAWLEGRTVDREVVADAGSSPRPYMERRPDPQWAAMLEAVSWFSMIAREHPVDWACLPQGALAGAIGNVARKEEAEATLTNRLEDASRWVMIWVDCDGFDDLEAIQAVMGSKP